jgi:hypothetical protein
VRVTIEDRTFPPALRALHATEFPVEDEGDIDYEPFAEFQPVEETAWWLRLWTGNEDVTGEEFVVFGKDGTGGFVAFWPARPGRPLVEQPVVYLGSEGEVGVIAGDLAGYLWVLAGGVGPAEAVDTEREKGPARPDLRAVAERYAPGAERPVDDILAAARAEFPAFTATVDAMCR